MASSSKTKTWFPLESNPEVMQSYVENLGLKSKDYRFYDVLSTEEWALAMLPRPVVAVLMLFPIKESTREYDQQQATKIQSDGQVVSNELYFMKQTVGNACGTIGLLHALGNARDQLQFESGSFLEKFFTKTVDKSPDEIAQALAHDDQLETTHETAAKDGQTQVQESDDPVDTHFICFTTIGGQLYELDGRKEFPINHGDSTSETLLEDACVVIKQFMERDPGEMRFTIIAFAKAPLE